MGDCPGTRHWWAALAGITLLALALRGFAIDAQSYWYDEAITQNLITQSYARLANGEARDNGNPPLYWLVAKAWVRAFGDDDVTLRWLSAVFGVLTVPLLGLVGRRLSGPAVGLGAALLFAVSPLEVELGNEARTYALLHFLVVANAWFFVRGTQDSAVSNWCGYALTMFAAGYAHYYAFLLPLVHLAGLLGRPAGARPWGAWAAALAVAGTLWAAAWLPAFADQLGTQGNLSRSGERWTVQFVATPITFAVGRTLAWRDSAPPWLAFAALGTLLGFVVPGVAGAARLGRCRFAAALTGAWLLVPILVPLAAAVAGVRLYSHRYAAIGLPACCLLVAAGYTALAVRYRVPLAAAAIAATVLSLCRYATEPLKDDWRAATPYLEEWAGRDRLLVMDTSIDVASFLHYAARSPSGPPAEIIGVNARPGSDVNFNGIRFASGDRVDLRSRDYEPEILGRDCFRLVLCVPAQSPDQYVEYLRSRGFRATDRRQFHHIDVVTFAREGTSAPAWSDR